MTLSLPLSLIKKIGKRVEEAGSLLTLESSLQKSFQF